MSVHTIGRVSRVDVANDAAVWLLFASMFAIFSVCTIGLSVVVPELRTSACLLFGVLLGAIAAAAFLTQPPALATKANHVSIAAIYLAVAIGMVSFRPASLIPLAPLMFLGPYAASRLTSRSQIAAHCLAASVAVAIPAVLGLIGTAATFGVAAVIPAIWLLALCVVIILEAAEAQGAELEQLVRRDPLTGAGNRRLLDEQLVNEIERHERSGQQLSLLALDLNGFKALNDRLGHAAGDATLQEVACALQAITREQDIVVRQGGDEFCVLLTHTSRDQARFVERLIRTQLAGLADGEMPITTGIGTATYPDDGQTPSELLKVADARLAIDKEHQDPLLDPRRQGAAAVLPPAANRAPSAPRIEQPTRVPVGLMGQVSRRDLARNPYLWRATGLVFSLFAALAAGCAWFLPDAPAWSYAVPVAAAAVAAKILTTRAGPAMDSWANHTLLAYTYVGSAVFTVAFPAAAGAGLAIGMFIGILTAVRLINRRQIATHLAAATLVFVALMPAGLVDLTTALALGFMLFSMWGLGVHAVVVLEATERQGDELEHLARRDPLTGLGNRRLLTERLTHELARHHRTRRPFTVLALDLNGFKPLNDQFGHAAGDEALIAVARAIEGVVGKDDTVVRQGGDEFCVLLPDQGRDHAVTIAEAIRTALTEIPAHGLTITTGVGIASYPTDAGTADALLEVADDLLRASKAMAAARERHQSAVATAALDPPLGGSRAAA